MRKRNFLYSLIAFAMTCTAVHAQNAWYVDAGVAASGDGKTWSAAYKTLEEAIGQTTKSSTDVIFVKKGTYTAPSTDGLGYFFDQKKGVTLYGNCDGTESMDNLPVVDMDTELATVLKAPVEGGEALGRVITIYKGAVTFIGFDIEGGDASKAATTYGKGERGGAVWMQGGTLRYCKIHGAQALAGGGVHLERFGEATPTVVEYCEIYDNETIGTTTANQGGGGVYLNARDCFVKDCIIRNNTTTVYGGGIYSDSGSPSTSVISNCIIKNNTAVRSGAAVLNRGIMVNCLITGNTGSNSVGAIQLGSTAMVLNSTIVNNKVTDNSGAGGIAVAGGVVKNCIVWGNMINNGATNMDLRLQSHNTNEVNISTVINTCYATASGSTDSHAFQPVITNCIDSDPLFTSATDFTLQAASPCKNTGDNAAYDLALYPDKDLNGNARIQDETIDMGAYEGQGNPTTKRPVLSSDAIEIYSPAQHILTVKHEGDIAIYDISGKLQVTKTISGPTEFSLSSGMYIVSVAGQAYKAIVK